MESRKKKRCLGGLRKEDQGERSPQTFLVDNFSLLNRGENKAIGVLSSEFWIQVADLKQLPGL